jgi:hypothetical protein
MDAEAYDLWGRNHTPDRGMYWELSREKYGMWGKTTSRGHVQVLRLALIYALLDGAPEIRRQHLDAAFEVWRYCDESARYIFGDRLGNPIADTILDALKRTPAGLTRREISGVLGHNKKSAEITTALELLQRGELARFQEEKTGGAKAERWFSTLSVTHSLTRTRTN